MRDGECEWDDAKAKSNLAKHGVSFEAARRVFDDAFAFERLDIGSQDGEARILTIGMVNGVFLTVVLYGAWRAHPDHLGKKSNAA